MRLRALSGFFSKPISIEGTGLTLRAPHASDFEAWRNIRETSRNFLTPWEPKWPADDLTKIGFRRRLRIYSHQRMRGTGRTFLICSSQTHDVFGGISLTRITGGTSKSASLGYWMGEPYAGQGIMKKAVLAMQEHAFRDLRINRLEAAALPRNVISINLLKSCGFQREGYAREYLEINGKLEDHILFALLRSDYLAST